ncbi:hypothetical protein MPSEU_000758200 [Mayamaea pseudoterrestris]|nr:hypothetical protein MPSEU_000758200 [Mayamaea pseudoterrestris]
MGHITLFTTDDLNSTAAKLALDARDLPYVEINLHQYPQKKKDLLSQAGTIAVPQAFFNTRLVGGLPALQKELQGWDTMTKYKSARERFDKEILKFPEPSNKNLAKPDADPTEKAKMDGALPSSKVQLPDGNCTTVHDITRKLCQSLPRSDIKVRNSVYANCFTGEDLRSALEDSMALSTTEAESFCQYLVDHRILHHIGSRSKFKGKASDVYRLQCLMAPDVLNSYCFWTADVRSDTVKIVENLLLAMTKIEKEAFTLSGYSSKIDYSKIKYSSLFPAFEEAICELQDAKLTGLTPKAKLVTCMNVYNLMLRYAFIKIGFPKPDDMAAFLTSIKFKIQGQVFSLQDWVDGIMRGNRKSGLSKQVPFSGKDARKELAFTDFDNRVHYCLASGFSFGSPASLPFGLFTSDNVYEQLDIAAQVFAEADHNVRVRDGTIGVNSLFEWYRADFPSADKDLLEQLTGLMSSGKRMETRQVVSNSVKGNIKLQYVRPDWSKHAMNCVTFDKKATASDATGIRAILRRFKIARFAPREAARLETLESLNILDTQPEERFDRLTRALQQDFDMPFVFVSLVDEERLWLKSNQWNCEFPKTDEVGRDVGFCSHAILNKPGELFLVPDLAADDRFADSPIVAGDLGLRFYAGYPLDIDSVDGNGTVNVGTLCLLDRKPRELTQAQLEKIREYGKLVKTELLKKRQAESLVSV